MPAKPHSNQPTKVIPLPLKKLIPKYPDRVAIPSKSKVEIINVTALVYLKANGNYTEIHLENGSKLMASITLKRFEKALAPDQFFRVHQGYLVNSQCLKTYHLLNQQLELTNGSQLPVSRSKRTIINQFLKQITP